MHINGPNPITAAALEAVVPDKRVHSAPPVPVPKDRLVEQSHDLKTTNVVVELQRNNTLVFKFIDETTGKVIQEFPPEHMLHRDEAPVIGPAGKETDSKQN